MIVDVKRDNKARGVSGVSSMDNHELFPVLT